MRPIRSGKFPGKGQMQSTSGRPARTAKDRSGPLVATAPKPPDYRLMRKWIVIVLTVCALFQLAISREVENLACVALTYVGSLIVAFAFFRPRNLRYFPLSSWMVIVFTLSSITVPLVFKTAEFEPVNYNLKYPYLTFGYSFLAALAYIAAHWIYSHASMIRRARKKITFGILAPLGVFRVPDASQLWMMGFVGTAAHAVIIARPDLNESGSPAVKACIALIPFTYAPFLMPFSFLVSQKERVVSKSSLLIPLYFLFSVIIAFAANGRGGVVFPLVTVAMYWLIGFLSNQLPMSYRQPRKMVFALIVAAVFLPIFSHLALAMVVVRKERGTSSPIRLVEQTIQAYGDTNAINQVVLDAQSNGSWDEVYIHNPVISRFVDTKFHDNGFEDTRTLSNTDRAEYATFLRDQTISLLPAPALDRLGVKLNKADVNQASGADFLHHLNTGAEASGFKTGSLLPAGVFLFGAFFLPILAAGSVLMFLAADCFSVVQRRKSVLESVTAGPKRVRYDVIFSPAILIMIWQCIYINFDAGSVTDWVGVLLRNLPVQVFFYVVLIRLTAAIAITKLLPQAKIAPAGALPKRTGP